MRKGVSILLLSLFLAVSLVMPASGASDEGAGTTGLTMDDAVNMALARSNSLREAQLNIDRSEEVRDNLANQLDYVPLGPTEEPYSNLYTGLASADIAYRMAKKTKTIEEDAVMMSTLQAYTDLLLAQENLDYAHQNLKQAGWQLNVGNLSYQQGMISQYEKNALQAAYEVAGKQAVSAEVALDSAYITFNNLIGMAAGDRPILAEKPGFNGIEVENLQTAINHVMNENPSVWLTDQYLKLAEVQLDLYDFTDSTLEPYTAKEIDVDKARLTAADSREQLEKLMRTIYNNILTLEEGYAMQQEAVKLAEEDLRIQKLKYEIGLATKTEVQAAEISLQEKNKALDQLIFQHELLKIAFEKPWTVSAMSSASSSSGM